MKSENKDKLKLWLIELVSLAESIINIFIIPFGHHVEWSFKLSLNYIKKEIKK